MKVKKSGLHWSQGNRPSLHSSTLLATRQLPAFINNSSGHRESPASILRRWRPVASSRAKSRTDPLNKNTPVCQWPCRHTSPPTSLPSFLSLPLVLSLSFFLLLCHYFSLSSFLSLPCPWSSQPLVVCCSALRAWRTQAGTWTRGSLILWRPEDQAVIRHLILLPTQSIKTLHVLLGGTS